MIILSDLSIDKLRKLYKLHKPKLLFAQINNLSKEELIAAFDKVSDKRLKTLITRVDKKYEEKPIKTTKDLLMSLNKYQIRSVAKASGITNIGRKKEELIRDIVQKRISKIQIKKIIEE